MGRHHPRPEQRPELRLSDADRDDAVTRLSEHYAAGRLDKDEFDERSDAVWTARTGADLVPVFADLDPVGLGLGRPSRRPSSVPGPGAWGRRGRFPLPVAPVLFALIGLIALTVLTHFPFVLLAFVAGGFVLRRRRVTAAGDPRQISGSRFWDRGRCS